MRSYWRSWIHFASPINTWTVSILYSSTDLVEKLLQRVDKCLITCNEQLTLITETRQWTECRALQKRGFWWKSSKSIFSALSKRPNRRKVVDHCLQKELKKPKKTKLELDLFKIVDCSLDGHGNYDSNLVTFEITSLKTNHILKSEEIRINQLVVQMI